MDNIGLKQKYSSAEVDNITVINLKGYYKLRKAELIQKLEAHPEQVLITGSEIPRNITGSVNTSAIFDGPLLDDITPVLQPTPTNSLLKTYKRS